MCVCIYIHIHILTHTYTHAILIANAEQNGECTNLYFLKGKKPREIQRQFVKIWTALNTLKIIKGLEMAQSYKDMHCSKSTQVELPVP